MKPKIGLIHYSYPPIIGGVETVVKQQAHLFANHDFQVTVLVGEGKEDRKDINLVEIPEIKSLKNSNAQLYDDILMKSEFPSEFYKLSEEIYKKLKINLQNINIIIVHNILTHKLNLAFNHAFKRFVEQNPEKKYIAWTHDICLGQEFKKEIFSNDEIEDFIYKPLPQVFYIVISDFLEKSMEKIIQFPKKTMQVIPNGIIIEEFLSLHTQTTQLISKHRLFEADLLILQPSKIDSRKNIDIAIKILNELKKTHAFPKLIITAKEFHHIKNSEYISKINRMIEDLDLKENIMILQDEIAKYELDDFKIVKDLYKICDIVFFLSNHENFGLPILEAGITKTPIVCSELEVFREIDKDNIYYADISRPVSEIGDFINNILDKNKQTGLFQKIKKKYNSESIFKNEFLPLINRILEF